MTLDHTLAVDAGFPNAAIDARIDTIQLVVMPWWLVPTDVWKPRTRQERLSQRPVRPLTQEESLSRDAAEIENLGKGGPIAMADFTLVNESTVQNLKKETEQFIASLNN